MSFTRTHRLLLGVLFAAWTAEAAISSSTQRHTRVRKLQDNAQVPIGFQSGPDPGATYGGSVVYRPDSNRIYVTGATNGNYFKSADDSDPNTVVSPDQSSCFLGIAEMPSADNAMKWVHAQQWETGVPEACNVLKVDRNPNNLPENNTQIHEKIYMLGFTGANGLLEPLRIESAFPAQQYGMILDIDVLKTQPNSPELTTTFWGGRLLQDGPVQYPIDMTLDDEGNIYVVSLQTYQTTQSQSSPIARSAQTTQLAKQMVNPWLTPYGSEYNMLVEQFLYDNPGYDDGVGVPQDPSNVPMDTTVVDNWRKPYGTPGGAVVAGIQFLGGLLIVVGSTSGHSEVFGNELVTNSNHTDTSINGFVTKLIPDSGSYYQFVVDNGAPVQPGQEQPKHKRSATSFQSIDFKDDYIMGMCSSPADPDNFYIVGTTEGQFGHEMDSLVEGEVHAFIKKVNVWTLLSPWTKQIGGDPLKKDVVRGLACTVTADAQSVYMGGVLENGASLSLYGQDSSGGDDVFLLEANTEDGELVFLRQIGTSGNDRLSPGGLTTDEYGNAILMGHTDGSFYRSRQYDQESEKTDDLFVMTVMRGTGAYKDPEVPDASEPAPTTTETAEVVTTPNIEDQTDEGNTAPPELEPADTTSSETAPLTDPPANETPDATEPPAAEGPTDQDPIQPPENPKVPFESDKPVTYNEIATVDHENPHIFDAEAGEPQEEASPSTQSRQRYGLVLFFIVVAIVGLITGLLAYRQMNKGDATTDRDGVLGYLNEFDVDDVDLKQSATGGYHCSYTNDLAHGINARAVSREGLFGPMSFGGKQTNDPLLDDPQSGGEISFTDEMNERDDISSIGSGIATPGRHSTHEPLIDTYDGSSRRRPADDENLLAL